MANPLPGVDAVNAAGTVAHVIQVALTPVFLLSGIGTLLVLFNTRQSRVSDHTEHAAELLSEATDAGKQIVLLAHLRRLERRRRLLDMSLLLTAVGAIATCGAASVLFLGGLREAEIAFWLYILFGVALGCTVGALVAFFADTVLAWHGLHREGPLPRSKVR